MRISVWTVALGLAAMLMLAAPSRAQPGRPPAKDWDIRTGAGVMIRPTFDGSDRYRARPLPYLSVNWRDTLTLDQTGLNAQLRRQTYRLGVGLTFDGGREEQDTGGIFGSGDDRLLGMGDIDFALGVRGFASWQVGPVELSTQVTKFTGAQNDGLVGRAGMSLPMPFGRSVMLVSAISIGWADGNYMQTFFGVTPQQASRSIFPRFDAKAGLQDVRASLNLIYSFSPSWFANVNIGATQLLGDSAASPISLSDTSVTGIAAIGYRL